MGQRHFRVDFIESFANTDYGEFSKWVHQIPFDPGGSCCFGPDYPISFFLESFRNGYR